MVLNASGVATLRAADTSHQCGSEGGLRTQPHHHSFTRCGQQWHTSTMDFLGPCSGPDNGPRFGPRGRKRDPKWYPIPSPRNEGFSPNRACSKGFSRIIKVAWTIAGVARRLRSRKMLLKPWKYQHLRKKCCCGCSAVVARCTPLQPQQHFFRKPL